MLLTARHARVYFLIITPVYLAMIAEMLCAAHILPASVSLLRDPHTA